MTLRICLIFIWTMIGYGNYRYLAHQPISQRNWIDRTRVRRIMCVLSGPLFWIVAIVGDIIGMAWQATLPKLRRFKKRWSERDKRFRAFMYDPPTQHKGAD
jgi:hypothetical protein